MRAVSGVPRPTPAPRSIRRARPPEIRIRIGRHRRRRRTTHDTAAEAVTWRRVGERQTGAFNDRQSFLAAQIIPTRIIITGKKKNNAKRKKKII